MKKRSSQNDAKSVSLSIGACLGAAAYKNIHFADFVCRNEKLRGRGRTKWPAKNILDAKMQAKKGKGAYKTAGDDHFSRPKAGLRGQKGV